MKNLKKITLLFLFLAIIFTIQSYISLAKADEVQECINCHKKETVIHSFEESCLACHNNDMTSFQGVDEGTPEITGIAGSGSLRKLGTGTLILDGENRYEGGTEIKQGTLQIDDDSNIGAPGGVLTFNGGTLRVRDDVISETRPIVVGPDGGTIDTISFTVLLKGNRSGEGDLVKTLTHAFNFGWDADNNAATAATIVGVIKGHRWMQQQDWDIKDRYRNTTRPSMPENETITRFGDRIIEVARRVITDNGGMMTIDGRASYRIRVQKPANVEPLAGLERQLASLRSEMKPLIEAGLAQDASVQEKARAAYLAICLGLADSVRSRHPARWKDLLASLEQYPKLLDVLFYKSPGPAGDRLRNAALSAGLKKPSR